MKFYYFANIRIPTERAHGNQIMEMCQALATLGHEVELIVPTRTNALKEDPFVYHDVRKIFKLKKLYCPDFGRLGKWGYRLTTGLFALRVVGYAFFKKGIFYTRDGALAIALRLEGKKVTWEMHLGKTNVFIKLASFLGINLVVITEALRNLFVEAGFPKEKILVAPDAADINRFNISISKDEARKQLNLPKDKKIILYKGSLLERKGPETLANAALFIKNENVRIVFIGGNETQVAEFRKQHASKENLSILGHRPRVETPIFQKASDVLVIPNTASSEDASLYTSPLKLFGYLASDRPIIASDVPALHEIVSDKEVTFFVAEDAKDLAAKIDLVLNDYEAAVAKARCALEIAKKYSWDNRAKNIVDFINSEY